MTFRDRKTQPIRNRRNNTRDGTQAGEGTKPAEIPVEVNAKIEFVINLKVAQALGRTIAPAVLFRADRLIR